MEFAEVERSGERLYLPGFGGDSSNAAIAAARQGAKVAYFTALGDDAFGERFLRLWDEEGVDRAAVLTRPGERTGIYFISYGPDGHLFSYYRAGSAAAQVTPAELPLDMIAAARVLHLSAISQAISSGCADAGFAAIRHAKANGTAVSYDTNLRLRLWPLDRARAVIHAALALADIARPSIDDARQLTGLDRPEDIADFYLRLGCRIVALTMGGRRNPRRDAGRPRARSAEESRGRRRDRRRRRLHRRLPRRMARAWRSVPRRGLRQRGGGAEDARPRRRRADPAPRRGRGLCARLKHDPEKWRPVFGKDHAPTKRQSGMTSRREVIAR